MIGYDLLDFNNGMRRRVTAAVWRFGYNLRNERENGAGRVYHRVGEAPSLLGYTGFAPLLGYDISGEIKREVDRSASNTPTLLGFGEGGGGNGVKQNARHCLVSSLDILPRD